MTEMENKYRDALLAIRSAMESLRYAPPEGQYIYLNRIQEELDDLPKDWDKSKYD